MCFGSKKSFSIIALAGMLIFALFPYITTSPGLRFEHVYIYVSLIFFLCLFFAYGYGNFLSKKLLLVFFLYLCLFVFIFVRSLLSNSLSLAFLSAVENMFQPLAIIFLVGVWMSNSDSYEVDNTLEKIIKVALFLTVLNTFFIFSQIFFDVWWLTKHFVGEQFKTASESISWYRGGGKGRFTGVFDQPFESGLFYSLVFYLWVYYGAKVSTKSLIWALSGCMVFIGGWLSGSKVFLFIGMFTGIVLWFFLIRGQIWQTLCFLCSIVFLNIILSFFTKVGMFASLFKGGYAYKEPFLKVVSGARFGLSEHSKIEDNFYLVWGRNPIVGDGFPSNYALDSAYLQIFSYGGMIGCLLYMLVIAELSCIGLRGFYITKEKALLLSILALIFFAGFGAPVLTINRVSIFIWVVVSLLIISIGSRSKVNSKIWDKIFARG
jgi:hypothetical protein